MTPEQPHTPHLRRAELRAFAWLMAVAALLYAPMAYYWRDLGDFTPHGWYIEDMLRGAPEIWGYVPNLLYHVTVAIPYRLLGGGDLRLAMAGVTVFYALLMVALWWWLLRLALPAPSAKHRWLAGGLSVALSMVAPITFLTLGNQYFGYFTPYTYHNPTMLPLRPLTVLLFIAAVAVYEPRIPRPAWWWRVPLVAALTLANILSKPSFMLILLPALGLFTLVRLRAWRTLDWPLLVAGIGVPAVALLGYQSLAYSAEGGGIAIEPLRTLELWAYHYTPEANQQLVLKFFLSIAFPLVVYLAYFPQARRDIAFNLAWLCFAGGAASLYLLVDTFDRVAGNLGWNAQVGVLVLWVASALFWVRQAARRDGRWWLGAGVFAWHLLAGLLWYAIHITAWWPQIVYLHW